MHVHAISHLVRLPAFHVLASLAPVFTGAVAVRLYAPLGPMK
jgi:hypothetical protein